MAGHVTEQKKNSSTKTRYKQRELQQLHRKHKNTNKDVAQFGDTKQLECGMRSGHVSVKSQTAKSDDKQYKW